MKNITFTHQELVYMLFAIDTAFDFLKKAGDGFIEKEDIYVLKKIRYKIGQSIM